MRVRLGPLRASPGLKRPDWGLLGPDRVNLGAPRISLRPRTYTLEALCATSGTTGPDLGPQGQI